MNKELIYINQRGLEAEKRNIQAGINNLNTFKNMAVRCLNLLKGTTIDDKPLLTESELDKLPTEGIEILKRKFKTKFPFPNADDDFNYDALGHNPYAVERFYKKHSHTWRTIDYEFNGVEFTAKEKQLRLERYYHYADTDKKIEAHKALQQFVESSNKLMEIGVLRSGDALDIKRLFRYGAIARTEKGIIINKEGFATVLSMLN